jgi:hypothetical protein
VKALAALVAFACSGVVVAQTADVRIKLDATLSYRTEAAGPTNLRLYSTDGRPSTLGLSFTLPPGFRGFVAEKLERITGDPDTSLLDEYYLEDPGLWRIGKQLIPFGLGRVVHETALAARADTNLIFQGLPVSVLACDAGTGLQRGVDARIGSRIGVSLFLGQDFGISSASFTQIREPEASPGLGHGYQMALALDGTRRFGKFELKGEIVSVSQGETKADQDMNVADGTISYLPKRDVTLSAGYTWVSPGSHQYLRFGGALPITRGVQFEPWIRFRDNALWDISLQIRVRV